MLQPVEADRSCSQITRRIHWVRRMGCGVPLATCIRCGPTGAVEGDGGDWAENPLALKGSRRALATPSAPARTVKTSTATPIRLSCDRGVASTKWLHTSLGLPAITDHARCCSAAQSVAKQPRGLS